jgi:hypothetical protein
VSKGKEAKFLLDYYQNVHLSYLLKRAAFDRRKNVTPPTVDAFASFLARNHSEKNEESDGKISRVFKAIKVGDVPLVAFYYGIDQFRETTESECHPFCDCAKCNNQNQVNSFLTSLHPTN